MAELADALDSGSSECKFMWVQVPSSAPYADMAELADALDSGSSDSNILWVQVPSSAPKKHLSKRGAFFA